MAYVGAAACCSRREVRSVKKHCEAWVGPQRIEEGMHLKKLHDVRSFLGGTLHPCKCFLRVTKSQISIQECGCRDVSLLSAPV